MSVGAFHTVDGATHTQTLTVVACVILQCISCFYECRCMSDGVFIQFVCQVFNLMVEKKRKKDSAGSD